MVHVPMHEIKACSSSGTSRAIPDRAERKIFRSRPRLAGLWVRMTFKDSEVLEALLPNNLLDVDPLGFLVTPPDVYSNNLRIFIPRTALTEMEVLGVISDGVVKANVAARRPSAGGQYATEQQFGLFASASSRKRNNGRLLRQLRCRESHTRPTPGRAPWHCRVQRLARGSGRLHWGQIHPLMNGVEDKFQPVGNPDLIVNSAKMVLDGLLGDGKVGADFPVAPALHQVADDGLLPTGQSIDRAGWSGGARLREVSPCWKLAAWEPTYRLL